MDILKLGTELLQKKFGGNMNSDLVSQALAGLIGQSDGKLDIQGLVKNFMGKGGLESVVGSWLGDGGNKSVSADKIQSIFGADKLSAFASTLGVGEDEAAKGLSDVIPEMIDKGSSAGSLMDNAGDLGGVMDMAKKFF